MYLSDIESNALTPGNIICEDRSIASLLFDISTSTLKLIADFKDSIFPLRL